MHSGRQAHPSLPRGCSRRALSLDFLLAIRTEQRREPSGGRAGAAGPGVFRLASGHCSQLLLAGHGQQGGAGITLWVLPPAPSLPCTGL